MKIMILAGGSGERLWPLSRKSYPKQFLALGDSKTLLQKTAARFLKRFLPQDILIITGKEYLHLVKHQCSQVHPDLAHQVLLEPEGKNTAPAIALGVKFLQERGQLAEDDCVLISSSDCLISPEELFLDKLQEAESIARQGYHLIFGVFPTKPETGYGYIQYKKADSLALEVEQFKEKPDLKMAQTYLESGNYLWNSGIFLFHIRTLLEELECYAKEIFIPMEGSFQEFYQDFPAIPSISIDYALMEKSQKTKVIPLPLSWSDIGSWDALFDQLEKDSCNNVAAGNVEMLGTRNCLLMGGDRLLTAIGLEDLLVVDSEDALLIAKRGESQKVKLLLERLKKSHPNQVLEHPTIYRPWGSYTVLEEGPRYKIKRIFVHPSAQLSLQLHYHRSEHWVVVHGTAKITLDEETTLLHENESVFVPISTKHRLENPGKIPLELIEVQVGEYVGEDDIVRFDDIYGRTEEIGAHH